MHHDEACCAKDFRCALRATVLLLCRGGGRREARGYAHFCNGETVSNFFFFFFTSAPAAMARMSQLILSAKVHL